MGSFRCSWLLLLLGACSSGNAPEWLEHDGERVTPARLNLSYRDGAHRVCFAPPPAPRLLVLQRRFDEITWEHAVTANELRGWRGTLALARTDASASPCATILSQDSVNLEPRYYDDGAWLADVATTSIVAGAFYGVMLVLVGFVALSGIVLRQRALAAYVAFQSASLALQTSLDGLLDAALGTGVATARRLEITLIALASLSGLWFARAFTEDLPLRRWQRAITSTGLAASCVMLLCALTLPLRAAMETIALGSLIVASSVLAFTLPLATRREPGVRAFVAGWAAYATAVLLVTLTDLGVLPSVLVSDAELRVGSLAEALLLSVALGYKIVGVRRERDRVAQKRDRDVADAKAEALQLLVAGVAHEIGNPLNFAKGAADELAPRLQSQPLEARLIALVERGIGRIDRIVNALRLATRGGREEPMPVDVAMLVNAALDSRRERVKVSYDGPRPALVQAVSGETEQIIENLIENAAAVASAIVVTVEPASASVRITVTDDGPGVADPKSLFVPFATTKTGGTGLGLWLSRELARKNRGDLAHVATPRGACFQLTLPACANSTKQMSAV